MSNSCRFRLQLIGFIILLYLQNSSRIAEEKSEGLEWVNGTADREELAKLAGQLHAVVRLVVLTLKRGSSVLLPPIPQEDYPSSLMLLVEGN